jgi:hypothetical protein
MKEQENLACRPADFALQPEEKQLLQLGEGIRDVAIAAGNDSFTVVI